MTAFHDYFLKCESQEQANTLLESAGLQVASDDGYSPTDGVSIYHVGVISAGGEWDDEGNEVVAPVLLDGWHVNLRLREPLTEGQLSALDGMIVDPVPSTPHCVWG